MKRVMLVAAVVMFLGCSSSGSDDQSSAGGSGGHAGSVGGPGGASGGVGGENTNAGSGGKITSGDSAGAAGEAGAEDARPCTGDLSELNASCEPTFDGSAAEAAAVDECTSYSDAPCDGMLWTVTGDLGGTVCAYDSSTHALIGVQRYNDVTSYCNSTSFDETAGRIPSRACLNQGHECTDSSVGGAAP